MPKRIDHIAIIVRDIEQALVFYRDTLGITPGEIKDVPGLSISTRGKKERKWYAVSWLPHSLLSKTLFLFYHSAGSAGDPGTEGASARTARSSLTEPVSGRPR